MTDKTKDNKEGDGFLNYIKSRKRNVVILYLVTFVAWVGFVVAIDYYEKYLLARIYAWILQGLGCAYLGYMVFMKLENKQREREILELCEAAQESYIMQFKNGSLVVEKEPTNGKRCD